MRRKRYRFPPVALLVLPAIVIGVPLAGVFLDGPPPGHTGGFGEPTCASCHFGGQPDSAGALRVRGLPAEYAPGMSYLLTLSLRHPQMRRAGYQLAVRFADGKQAGTLEPVDQRSSITPMAGVQYLHHTATGALPDTGETAAWRVRWEAPAMAGPVVVHLVGNAADGDHSQFGDQIYADSLVVPLAAPHRSRPE